MQRKNHRQKVGREKNKKTDKNKDTIQKADIKRQI